MQRSEASEEEEAMCVRPRVGERRACKETSYPGARRPCSPKVLLNAFPLYYFNTGNEALRWLRIGLIFLSLPWHVYSGGALVLARSLRLFFGVHFKEGVLPIEGSRAPHHTHTNTHTSPCAILPGVCTEWGHRVRQRPHLRVRLHTAS